MKRRKFFNIIGISSLGLLFGKLLNLPKKQIVYLYHSRQLDGIFVPEAARNAILNGAKFRIFED